MLLSDKPLLRKKIKDKVRQYSAPDLLKASVELVNKFVSGNFYQRSRVIFCFVSLYKWEVSTGSLLQMILDDGKVLAIPRLDFASKIMSACRLSSLDGLKKNKMGIKEPVEKIPLKAVELAVVPGVAFTKNGKRLGLGGGYYDRFLQNHPCRRVALVHNFQIVADLPEEEHDIRMDEVLTID